MHREKPIEAPPRTHGSIGPWVEISAWILAFAILLGVQCLPERTISRGEGLQTTEARAR